MQSYVVIGGGLAGLTAANALAKQGRRVTLVEQSERLGGRAATRNERGYSLNLGPHALYAGGLAARVLRQWDIRFSGRKPVTGDTARVIYEGRQYPLFESPLGLVQSRLLGLREKYELVRTLASVRPASAEVGESMAHWLDRKIASPRVRPLVGMLARVSSYAAELDHLEARAALRQLGLALTKGVLYLDGGWQTLVDGLANRARSLGVEIRTGQPVTRLPDADGVLLAISPEAVRRLTGKDLGPLRAARVASLDLGMRELPAGVPTVALAADTPFYYSMHSAAARLAPEGAALVHVAKYLAEGETAERGEMEAFVDQVLPGWRKHVELSRFVPQLVVTHALPGLAGRPDVDALDMDGVTIAGDWVGKEGMLADAAVASGLRAAAMVQRQQAVAA